MVTLYCRDVIQSIPDVLDATIVHGASGGDAPDLVIEIPHGATRTEDFTRLAARLASPLPDNLVDFFHVNTDAGAPELALAIAERLVVADPARSVCLLRCRIPRTFIDCNRRMDASPDEFRAGKVTPGLMPWIVAPEDRTLLRGLYDRYVAAVDHTGDLAIKRRCVVPGEIAWDNCQCGQLAISEVRRYPSREFPLEEIDHSAECGEPYLVVELVVSLTRCIPTVDANGNPPTCDALNTAARQLTRDKRLIRSAVMCCLTEIYDAPGSVLMGFEIGQHLSVGPAGLCGGSELTVLLGFANPCGC